MFNVYKRLFAEALKNAKIASWPHNALRHSFASYHLAFHQNAAQTALDLDTPRAGCFFSVTASWLSRKKQPNISRSRRSHAIVDILSTTSQSVPPIGPTYTPRPYLTEEELAKALIVTRRTIREWRERGWIPYLKIRGVLRFDLPLPCFSARISARAISHSKKRCIG